MEAIFFLDGKKKEIGIFLTVAKDPFHYVFSSKLTLFCRYLYLNYVCVGKQERETERERAEVCLQWIGRKIAWVKKTFCSDVKWPFPTFIISIHPQQVCNWKTCGPPSQWETLGHPGVQLIPVWLDGIVSALHVEEEAGAQIQYLWRIRKSTFIFICNFIVVRHTL